MRGTALRRDVGVGHLAKGRPLLLLTVLGHGGTMVYCQQTVVLPLAPRLAGRFDADPAAASWVVTASSSIIRAISGWVSVEVGGGVRLAGGRGRVLVHSHDGRDSAPLGAPRAAGPGACRRP